MQQVDIIRHLAEAAHACDALVVSEIGSQTQWLYSSGDHPSHLYLSGPMGMGPSVALGVALAQPDRPVLGICGDGALAMNLNALVTINHHAPKNLILALMDNGVYELTGKVESPTASMDWEKFIHGLPHFAYQPVTTADTHVSFSAAGGLTFMHAKLEASNAKAPSFPLAPEEIHRRFKHFLQTA